MAAVGGSRLRLVSGEGKPASEKDAEHETPDDLIEDYLDHLCAPLLGIVPYGKRRRLRSETAFHLEERMRQYLEEGLSEREAVLKAIDKHGRSEQVGQEFLETWFRHLPKGRLARSIGLANAYTLVPFAIATLLTTWLMILRVLLLPNPEPISFGLNYAQIRQVIPEPLPIPETNWESLLLYFASVVSPFVAGWYAGVRVPVGAARAVYQVMLPLVIYTFVLSTVVMPRQEGVTLALFQIFFWTPVGCAMAHVAGLIAWRRRSRRFVVRSLHSEAEKPVSG